MSSGQATRRDSFCRIAVIALLGAVALLVAGTPARAHPMGNFAICHYARIEADKSGKLRIRYVLDRAEIPTVSEKPALDPGNTGVVTDSEKRAYLATQVTSLLSNLDIRAGGKRLPLTVTDSAAVLSPGAGGLQTLKVSFDLQASAPPSKQPLAVSYADHNYEERTGWKEIILVGAGGASILDAPLSATDRSNGLSVYPKDIIPPQDTTADFRVAFDGVPPVQTAAALAPLPAVAHAASPPPGTTVTAANSTPRDPFTQAISKKRLTPLIIVLGLLIAFVYGGMHAFSPGHGKTIVGAYLVGSRGTAWHAVFLGATVTITHTLGVFALGLVTLFASKYVVPEKLYPILGVVSGSAIVVLGINLFIQRLTQVMGFGAHSHRAGVGGIDDVHVGNPLMPHTHGGWAHSHMPPGADGTPVTVLSLLTLGISGGLLPCPSALVVLLSAVALHRVAYGLLLVMAFSLGLAGTLTAIGLAFLHAGRLLSRSKLNIFSSPVMRIVPIFSALFVAAAGAFLVYGAVLQGGAHLFTSGAPAAAPVVESAAGSGAPSLGTLSAWAVLGLGLLFGLKHATEVDHVIAVSTIVSEHRNLARAALVGGLWGVGHTTSLMIVGIIVLALRVSIPERVANWLEFGVALMIITLSLLALRRSIRGRSDVVQPLPLPVADSSPAASPALKRIGIKPFIVGSIHGLAGSGTLTLLVLTQIASPVVGFLYLTVFGIGSIFGMLLMSGLVGLPFAYSARKLTGINLQLQAAASVFSLAFGFWYAYQTGIANGLLGVHL